MTKRIRPILLLAIALMLIAACQTSGAQESAEAIRTDSSSTAAANVADNAGRRDAVLSLFAEPPTLDPGEAAFIPTAMVLNYNVLEPLLQLNADGELEPLLAESWNVSSDRTTYIFHLREATFHDGSELTSDDVVFTYERHRGSDAFPYTLFDVVEEITAVDDRTVEISLSRPSNSWLYELAKGGAVVLSEQSIDQATTQPIGTGPFKIAEWNRGQSIRIERHDDYWGDPPALEQVTWRIIDDENAAINALLAGDIDGITSLNSPERVQEFQGNAEFTVNDEPSDTWWAVFMNPNEPPLDDPRVREAIVHAIDQQAHIDATQGGFGQPVCGWLSTTHRAYEKYCPFPYDPEAAAQLLADAGHGSGLELEMKAIQAVQSNVELVMAELSQVGITVKNTVMDDADYFAEVVNAADPEAPAFQLTVLGYPDIITLQQIVCPPTWWVGYCDEDVSQWLTDADTASTEDDSIELIRRANRKLTDDVVTAPLFNAPRLSIVNSDLTGYKGFRVDNEFDVRSLQWAE